MLVHAPHQHCVRGACVCVGADPRVTHAHTDTNTKPYTLNPKRVTHAHTHSFSLCFTN